VLHVLVLRQQHRLRLMIMASSMSGALATSMSDWKPEGFQSARLPN
jgi:hypothetical protein